MAPKRECAVQLNKSRKGRARGGRSREQYSMQRETRPSSPEGAADLLFTTSISQWRMMFCKRNSRAILPTDGLPDDGVIWKTSWTKKTNAAKPCQELSQTYLSRRWTLASHDGRRRQTIILVDEPVRRASQR